jgi:dUTP diphosphatase
MRADQWVQIQKLASLGYVDYKDFEYMLEESSEQKLPIESAEIDRMLDIKFKKLTPTAHMPTYARDGDAGLDLFSNDALTLWAFHGAVVNTGISMAIPKGYFGLVRPRSGLANKYKISGISSGVIDSGYRGEIRVQLHNFGHLSYDISVGDRIAQLLILPVLHAVLEEVDELPISSRGEGGFGSTGK